MKLIKVNQPGFTKWSIQLANGNHITYRNDDGRRRIMILLFGRYIEWG